LWHEYVFRPLQHRTSKVTVDAHCKHDELAHETTNTDLESPAAYEEPKTSKLRNVLITGLPHPRLRPWSYATIAINVLLTLFTLDLVFRAPALYSASHLRFSRVGFVDDKSAKILFREPDTNQLPVYASYRAQDSTSWITADKIYYLDEETDYTYPISLTHLRPATTYTYALSNNLSGNFTTSSAPGTPAAASLTFVTSSCIKANFPYNPLNHALNIPGFKHLSKVLTSLPSPAQFMLFLGDFIYVDVPLRLSSTASHYRAEYRRVYASPSWSLPRLTSLPWLHTLDDHEIANDWSGGNSTPPYPSAHDPFQHYHVSVNPPIPPHSHESDSKITYFQFASGPASFFMLDTRAYRTPPDPINPSNPNATILGPTQLQSLLLFLRTPEPGHIHWKILASSVPFTKNWRFGNADTWGGFPAERAKVLEAMHFAERRLGVRVVILSGDRHEFGAIRFPHPQPSSPSPPAHQMVPEPKSQSGPHEFSVGPLSMFYLPFRTFHQVDDEDVTVKYVPDGNSKIGVVHIEALEGDRVRSLMRYSLWIDGTVRWEYVLSSPAEEFWDRTGISGGVLGGLGEALWS
jgi:alkaline phosphatase D